MSWKNKRGLNVGFHWYYFYLFLHHFIPSQTLTSFTIEYDFLHLVCHTLFMACQGSTSSQFNHSKHCTMRKACRISVDNPFSIKLNGQKQKFFRNFPYALNGWFLAEITLANNFKKFSFVTIFNILQSSLKKIWILISFPMLGQGKYVLSYFSPMLDFKWDTLHNLLPFVQFKKREKHPCRSATFSKVEIKVTILRGSFHVF